MDYLDRELANVTAEITRTDTKAAALLSGGGILAAALGLITAGGHAEPITTAIAAAFLAAALIASTFVIRPHTANNDEASWPHWATLDEQQLHEELAEDRRPGRVVVLSGLAMRKMTALRWAADLTIGAILAIALAAAVAAR